ncbi:MAG TPA: SDR family oxidoreductase [Solirubrobacteraceae bacterium]|jgi:NAD(P)-dependent dehydrogenase (short-subunit alcohol dehydrogenase family)|nr:SDR family oxidoreductase [Solirubrobacteraceae bacterium]
MDLQLEGKRAVVTGGSRGIGLAAARALAAEGCDVALVARGAQALEEAAASVAAQSGRTAVAIPADTGADDSVARMAREAIARLGGVDVLVNAAARPNRGTGITEDDLEFELNVKLRGYLRCARALAPEMAARGWGRIVNVSGLAARNTGSIVGSVRNVAVAAMTKNLAEELGPQGINVTVVHPGMTVTEATAGRLEAIARQRGTTPEEARAQMAASVSIGRLVTAEEVAWVIAFLASPRSVAINGDAVVAGGGQRGTIHY